MNKRFSTLLAAFAAITVFSTAQTKHVMLLDKASGTKAMSWSKDVPAVDSVKMKPILDLSTKAQIDSALWEVKLVSYDASNDSICTFTNKATKQKLSWAKKVNATPRIASGVDQFVFRDGFIFAAVTTDKIIAWRDDNTLASNLTDALAVAQTPPSHIRLQEVSELTGKAGTSFLFTFAGKAENIFTKTELIPTVYGAGATAVFKFQVMGQEKSSVGTKADQFITIDTISYGGTVKSPRFQLDTLALPGAATYKGLGNGELQSFSVHLDPSTDSLYLQTVKTVVFNDKDEYSLSPMGTYLLGYKTLANSVEVLTADNVQITAPFITIKKGTPVKLPDGPGVYSMKLVSTGDYKRSENGKYLVYRAGAYGYTSAYTSDNAAHSQMFIKENNDDTYSMQSRENDAITSQNQEGRTVATAYAPAFSSHEPLYAVKGAPAGVFAFDNGTSRDTAMFTKLKVDPTDRHVGYKYITKEQAAASALVFRLVSKASDEIFLATVNDSIVHGARSTFNDALQLRFNPDAMQMDNDTVYYGAAELGDTLMRVSYTMQRIYNRNATFYSNENQRLVKMAQFAPEIQRYFFVADPEEPGYMIVKAGDATVDAPKSIVMNATTLAIDYSARVANNKTTFTIEDGPSPIYAKVAPGHYNVNKEFDMLTNNNGYARFMRVNDLLKSGKKEEDFAMYIDSAYVNRGADNQLNGYYIYRGVAHQADSIKGTALTVGKDDSYNHNHVVGDSALFVPITVVGDFLWYADGTKAGVQDALNRSVMMFRTSPEGYVITPMNHPTKTMALVNGVVIFTSNVIAQPVTLKSTKAPTSNEEIEAGTVKVVAGQGTITVYGAAGKRVVVSDVIGKTTTVIATSDNETIAAQQGVVFVAVDGQATVKAVVR